MITILPDGFKVVSGGVTVILPTLGAAIIYNEKIIAYENFRKRRVLGLVPTRKND